MADIGKINTVAIADVAIFGGVAIADIGSIGGTPIASGSGVVNYQVIGSAIAGNNSYHANMTIIDTTLSPSNTGKIVEWKWKAAYTTGATTYLRVFRNTTGNSFTSISTSSNKGNLAANTLYTFEEDIDIQAGDIVGMYCSDKTSFHSVGGSSQLFYYSGNPTGTVSFTSGGAGNTMSAKNLQVKFSY